jgi:hypothetical protein
MTSIPGLIPGPTDIRRAAAFLIHANPDATNLAGIAAIVSEIKDDRRITELLAALVVVAYSASEVPLSTPEGQAGLARIVNAYATQENTGKDTQ